MEANIKIDVVLDALCIARRRHLQAMTQNVNVDHFQLDVFMTQTMFEQFRGGLKFLDELGLS